MNVDHDLARYGRQMRFDGWGRKGQRRLAKARVAQVGCGALGSTLAQCMIRAGVGEYTIIDKDRVDITNLHRQFLFDETDVARGSYKARAAAAKLRRVNSQVKITAISRELTEKNVARLLSGHDLVLDALDNMPSRMAINRWCVENRVPWIYAGVAGASGMIMTILPGNGPDQGQDRGPCLECIFPGGSPKACATTDTHGIIPPVPAAIAAIQAVEACKLIIKSPDLIRDFRIFDLWTGAIQSFPIRRDPKCPVCKEV